MELAIRRMRHRAQLPQQLFLKQLEDYREISPTEWREHFPVGFREQLPASFLSEVYASGKTAEQWARDCLRDRSLTESHVARELAAARSAIDTMIMTDQGAGLLNKVSTAKRVATMRLLDEGFEDRLARDRKRGKKARRRQRRWAEDSSSGGGGGGSGEHGGSQSHRR